MTLRPLLSTFLALSLAPLLVAPARAQDPCLLTLTEARELGGSKIDQAAGDARLCNYVTASGESHLSILVDDIASPDARVRLEELGDAARFTSRKKGKVTYWVSRDDELAGWVRRGELLAAVRADGEASPKRRRNLELALQRVGERLR